MLENLNPLEIMQALQAELRTYIQQGHGPFLAAIYNEQGALIAKAANSVVQDQCSHAHAEMNAIRLAQQKLKTYDLSPYQLSLFVTSEPCLMCVGGIMWSGLKAVYYGVPSAKVEKITGFDEGFKPHWAAALQRRGIEVQGNLAVSEGEAVLRWYVEQGHPIYRPHR
jgi:tRNA(Arg) A34 adenosine deaminase TadA